jgi:hypothetical protein
MNRIHILILCCSGIARMYVVFHSKKKKWCLGPLEFLRALADVVSDNLFLLNFSGNSLKQTLIIEVEYLLAF